MNVDINKDTAGVSPVIGVVLMVAITVILAAVVGSFALGLVGGQQQNPSAAVTFDERTNSSGNVFVEAQVVSVDEADELRVEDGNGNSQTLAAEAGASAEFDLGTSPSETEFTVVGTLDGKDAVIQSFTYEP